MRYTAKKIATMLLTMVIVSFLTFVAFSLLSGDAATRLLGTEATPERLEALRIELGLNDPLLVRYGRWLWDALRGDLGTSYRYGQSVSSLIAQRLGPTLTLTALAFALIVAVSIPFGVLSAKYAGGRLDRALTVINQVVMAVPPFFTGILFTYLFGLVLHLFIAGAFPAGGVGHYIGYLFFPALAVALPRIAMTVKLLRTSILDEAQRDYVRTSMSRGRSRSGILYRHVLKNTLVPVLTFLAMTVADLLAGSVVIEQVFAVPGLGRLIRDVVPRRRDRLALQEDHLSGKQERPGYQQQNRKYSRQQNDDLPAVGGSIMQSGAPRGHRAPCGLLCRSGCGLAWRICRIRHTAARLCRALRTACTVTHCRRGRVAGCPCPAPVPGGSRPSRASLFRSVILHSVPPVRAMEHTGAAVPCVQKRVAAQGGSPEDPRPDGRVAASEETHHAATHFLSVLPYSRLRERSLCGSAQLPAMQYSATIRTKNTVDRTVVRIRSVLSFRPDLPLPKKVSAPPAMAPDRPALLPD